MDDSRPDPMYAEVNRNVCINSGSVKHLRTTQHGSLYKPSGDKFGKKEYICFPFEGLIAGVG